MFYYLDRYLAYTGVYIYQNSENTHLRLCITLNVNFTSKKKLVHKY